MKIAVILGTDCENQVSENLAKWVASEAGGMQDIEVDLVDLKEYSLSFLDGTAEFCPNQYQQAHKSAQDWLDKIARADAYVFVTPEHNHTFPGRFKNAFEYVTREMYEKPAAIVSYGVAGGSHAAKHLKEIIRQLQAVPIPAHLEVIGVKDLPGIYGKPDAQTPAQVFGHQPAMKSLLSELSRYRDALTAAGAYA